jgi:hypothetical protein
MCEIKKTVNRGFRELPTERGAPCRNPVTGSGFVRGIDPLAPQKRKAERALVAREWCAFHGPHDLPPLPIHAYEIDDMKSGRGLLHLFAYFAQSLVCRDYRLPRHPPFEMYARGVLAYPHAPEFFTNNQELRKRFPPKPLPGMGPGLVWRPRKEHAALLASQPSLGLTI